MYLCGAKKILKASPQLSLDDPENLVLMDWIYYHEVMSEFGLRHWVQPRQQATVICREGPFARSPRLKKPDTATVSILVG